VPLPVFIVGEEAGVFDKMEERSEGMVIHGHIQAGAVVIDGPVDLPDGTRVTIEAKVAEGEGPTLAEALKEFIGQAKGLPSDAAKNHDHYLYGAAKK